MFFAHEVKIYNLYIYVNKNIAKSFCCAKVAPVKYRRQKSSRPIPVLLDQPLLDRITALSERIGEPKSTVMRIAMRIGLDALEKAMGAAAPNLSGLIYPSGSAPPQQLNEPAPKKKTGTR